MTAFEMGCVLGTGPRKLLKLAGAIGNNGPDDFVVGNPALIWKQKGKGGK